MATHEPTSDRPALQPLDPTPYNISFLARLLTHVRLTPAGCWEWTAATTPSGYGSVAYRRKMRPVHRIVYQLCVADPGDLYVCHDCPAGDNPLCFNPAHLFLGTQKQNIHDAMSKGRLRPRSSPSGTLNPNAKLTDEAVQEIRRRVATGPRGTQKQLESELNLSRATIQRIVRGQAWQHVSGYPSFSDGGGI